MTLKDGYYKGTNHVFTFIIRVETGLSRECIRIDGPNEYHNRSTFQDGWGVFTPATPEDEYWLYICIKLDKIVPKPTVAYSSTYEIY